MTRTAGYHYPEKPDWTDGPVYEGDRYDRPTRAEAERDEHESGPPRKLSPEERADFDKRWGLDKPPWRESKKDAHEHAEEHLETEVKQGLVGQGARQDYPNNQDQWDYGFLDAAHGMPAHLHDPHGFGLKEGDDEAYLDGHQTRKNHTPARIAAMGDGSFTDGKIVGQCPGCTKPIRKHKTAHGDELRHLHNNHVRCFGEAKTAGGADLPAAAGEAAAEDVPGVGNALRAADVGGKALNGIEHELEKTPDMWAYRAESALQMYADYLGRPDANNPTGRGPDEYKANTWDAFQRTRPMQSGEDRGINTPVLPAEPIKTRNINTPTRGLEGREDDLRHSDDDDDED